MLDDIVQNMNSNLLAMRSRASLLIRAPTSFLATHAYHPSSLTARFRWCITFSKCKEPLGKTYRLASFILRPCKNKMKGTYLRT